MRWHGGEAGGDSDLSPAGLYSGSTKPDVRTWARLPLSKASFPSCKIRRFKQTLLKNAVIQYNCSFLYIALAEKRGSNQAQGQAFTFLQELTQEFISMPSAQAQVCLKLRPNAHTKIHGREADWDESASPPTAGPTLGVQLSVAALLASGEHCLPGGSELETYKMDLGTDPQHKCQQDWNILQSAFQASGA